MKNRITVNKIHKSNHTVIINIIKMMMKRKKKLMKKLINIIIAIKMEIKVVMINFHKNNLMNIHRTREKG